MRNDMPLAEKLHIKALLAASIGVLLVGEAQASTETVYERSFTYDELGQLIAEHGAQGQLVSYTYDANGNLTSVTDGEERSTIYTYDALDRVDTATDPLGGTTRFTYDAGDRPTSVKDPKGHTTSYAYDGFGQLWSQTSPDTGTTTFAYNAWGQRTSTQRNDGSQLAFEYNDALGRLTALAGGGERREFKYDTCQNGLGRLCQVDTKAGGATLTSSTFSYTPQGQLSDRHDTGSGANDITSYRYDGMGRLTQLIYPSGVSANYAYSHGRLQALTATLPSGGTINVATNIAHDPSGAVKGWTYGNGLVRGHNHDLDGRLTGISSVYGGAVHQSLTLAYDDSNLVQAITDGVDASRTHHFQYDDLGRLAQDTIGGTTVMDYGFDAVGNRTTLVRQDNGVQTSTQAYPIESGSNRMLAMVGNANRNFFYNPNGHLESSTGWLGNRTYAYDAFDRLKSTTVNGTTTSYLVNALDQRVGKSGPLGSVRYVYSGQNTLLGEHTGAGLTGWRNYLYLDGQPVALISGNNVRYFLHTDHLGRPEMMTDANRAAVWKAFNGAYSRSVTLGDPTRVVLGFPGQQWDEETQSWYNGFRDYDPYTGRYIQSDPIGLGGGLNTYVYVGGNPINAVDPFGLQETPYGNQQALINQARQQNVMFNLSQMDFKLTANAVLKDAGTFGMCVAKCVFTAVVGSTPQEFAYNVHEQTAIKAIGDAAKDVGSKCLTRVAGVAGIATNLRDAGVAGSCSADCLSQ